MSGDGATSEELKRWFAALRDHDQALRRRFADSAADNVKRLPQRTVHKQLTVLADTFWSQDDARRQDLRSGFWATLCTLKLVADDTYVEATQIAVSANDVVADTAARTKYKATLLEFIRANPFALSSADRGKQPYHVGAPSRLLHTAVFEGMVTFQIDDTAFLVGVLVRAARDAQSKLRATTTTTVKDIVVPPDISAVLGTTFLLLQLLLSDLREIGGPPTFPGDAWYPFAAPVIDELRKTVLGFFWTVEREARDAGRGDVADALQKLGDAHLDILARIFSVRVFETAAAWSFRHRSVVKAKGATFGQERIVVGANKEQQTLMSYLGRPNPDGRDDLEMLSVEALVGRAREFEGKAVKVIGQVNAAGTRLVSLATTDAVAVTFDRIELRFAHSLTVAVEIDGTFTQRSGIVATAVLRFADVYFTPVGFPLAVADTGPEASRPVGPAAPPVPLDLQPTWRTPTLAESAEAQREERDHVPSTLAGQQRLVRDLLASTAVQKALRKRSKTLQPLELHDGDVRGVIWKALFGELDKADPKTSLDKILAVQQRFHTHFTRHTLWNVHDDDPMYFSEKWPLTISGRALRDCGVYAVLTALDLKRALAGTSKAMHFGFVTFLNHIALVVYQDDRSAFINNDIVHGPKQMASADNKSDTTRADFALRTWGTLGFALVYKIQYSVALVRVPEQTIPSNLSDPAFMKKLWSFYKATAVWWGLQPGIADTYHQNVGLFDRGMVQLDAMLGKLTKNRPASQLVDATTLATTLYNLADQLASKSNFGQRPGVKGTVKEVSAMGVIAPAGKDLPIYAVVRYLAAAKKRGETLTADQDALVQKPATLQDHADQLDKVP